MRSSSLYKLARFEDALAYVDLCDELQPNQPTTPRMRGLILLRLKRFDEALVANRRAYDLDPNDHEVCNNIGDSLLSLGHADQSLEWFDKALAQKPEFVVGFTNKASALAQLHRFDEAFAIYDHLKATGSNTPMGIWNLSLIQMLTGDFEAGWAGREARWEAMAPAYPNISQPKWLGQESIEGKTIVVHTDEGMGDCIQFARYLPMMVERGAHVILVVAAPLVPLLSGVKGVSQCFSSGTVPPFDMHCPMGSLPLAFQTRLDSIPAEVPYLPFTSGGPAAGLGGPPRLS